MHIHIITPLIMNHSKESWYAAVSRKQGVSIVLASSSNLTRLNSSTLKTMEVQDSSNVTTWFVTKFIVLIVWYLILLCISLSAIIYVIVVLSRRETHWEKSMSVFSEMDRANICHETIICCCAAKGWKFCLLQNLLGTPPLGLVFYT